jgi:hypothetical protein
MTIVLEGSDYRRLCDPSTPLVKRFKLSEITNIDQSPLPYEHQKGCMSAKSGAKTVTIKGGKSG